MGRETSFVIERRGEKWALPADERSNARDPLDRKEEDLMNAASSLFSLVRPDRWPTSPAAACFDAWQDAWVFLIRELARHFEVLPEDVVGLFTVQYGPSLCYALLMLAHAGREEGFLMSALMEKAGVDPRALSEAQRAGRPDPVFASRAGAVRPRDPRWALLSRGPEESAWRHGSLQVICSVARELDGKHWLHVSCSKPTTLPTWEELSRVKEAFVGVEEQAVSLFPRQSQHVNLHPFCLHLWCCLEGDPLPDFTRGLGTI